MYVVCKMSDIFEWYFYVDVIVNVWFVVFVVHSVCGCSMLCLMFSVVCGACGCGWYCVMGIVCYVVFAGVYSACSV